MKMADFKALTQVEQITVLNNHLTTIKGMSGRLEDNFKTGMMDFSYSLLKKNAKELGLIVDGKNYVAYAAGDEPPAQQNVINQTSKENVVNVQQDIVNVEKVVKQQQNNVKQDVVNDGALSLTQDEILFVKELFANKNIDIAQKQGQTLFMPQFMGKKKTTGISVYVELWERWSEFKSKHPMYSGTDLLALALEEFMQKYDGTDD